MVTCIFLGEASPPNRVVIWVFICWYDKYCAILRNTPPPPGSVAQASKTKYNALMVKYLLLVLSVAILGSSSTGTPQCGYGMPPGTDNTEYACQVAGEPENCSGLPFGYGANFQVSRNVHTDVFQKGYVYTCGNWARTGDCCTVVNLPSCPSSTCVP